MSKFCGKTVCFAFFIILTIVIGGVLTGFSTVHASNDVGTAAFIDAEPNPVGVNQSVTVSIWVLPTPPTSVSGYHNLAVHITSPSGTSQSETSLTTDSQGKRSFTFVPQQTGTWNFTLSYLGETIGNSTISPSDSPVTELVVQQQPIQPYPNYPTPASIENWTFPISGMDTLWSSFSGNWLMRGYNASSGFHNDVVAAFNPYSNAPLSAHIVWIKPFSIGGLVGGEYGNATYYSGLPNEYKFAPPVIIDGKIYYNVYSNTSTVSQPIGLQGFICLDLRTGQELWQNNNASIDVGQLFNFVSLNQAGVNPYLWSTSTSTYRMYDANNGNLINSFANATPAGPATNNPIVFGSDGTMFVYILNGSNGWLALWNSTKAFQANGMIPVDPSGVVSWRPTVGTFDWNKGIQWNITVPVQNGSENIQGISNGVIVAMTGSQNNYPSHTGYDAITGAQIWAFNRTTTGAHEFTANTAFGSGIYTQFDAFTRTYFAYNIQTGQQLWQSDTTQYPWGSYSGGSVIAYSNLYATSGDGHVYAFNITNGKENWKFSSGQTTETPSGTYPFRYGPIIANGVVYAGTGEQVQPQTLDKGNRLFGINSTSGQEIWNITGLMQVDAIADNYLLAFNVNDNQIYCFGKGETSTTISLSTNVIENGTSILIQGTVADLSPAQPGTALLPPFYMAGWLQYLHMQQPCPYAVIPGVPVELRAIMSNGTTIQLGNAISDEYNHFSFIWTPPNPDNYRVVARFHGDNSYYVTFNWAESILQVKPASSVSTEKSASDYTPIDLFIIAALIVAIILVVYNIFYSRKQRKQS